MPNGAEPVETHEPFRLPRQGQRDLCIEKPCNFLTFPLPLRASGAISIDET